MIIIIEREETYIFKLKFHLLKRKKRRRRRDIKKESIKIKLTKKI
jgi:hypothetical protein